MPVLIDGGEFRSFVADIQVGCFVMIGLQSGNGKQESKQCAHPGQVFLVHSDELILLWSKLKEFLFVLLTLGKYDNRHIS